MKNSRPLIACAAACAALLASGCSTPSPKIMYSGPERPRENVALIVGTTNLGARVFSPNSERISIMAVNEKETVPWYSFASNPTAVLVEPGRQRIDVQYEWVHGVARGPIWVDARTNRVYRVKVMNPQARTERVYFVVEDITAQTLVGGQESRTPEVAPAPAAQ